MRLSTRKLLDKSFTGLGLFSILLMCIALIVLLLPIFVNGIGAVIFRETVEHRRFLYEAEGEGNREKLLQELRETHEARKPVYAYLDAYERVVMADAPPKPRQVDDEERKQLSRDERRQLRRQTKAYEDFIGDNEEVFGKYQEIQELLKNLFGPRPESADNLLKQPDYVTAHLYGQTRWEGVKKHLKNLLYVETYDYSDPAVFGAKVMMERKKLYEGTELEPMFDYVEDNIKSMFHPRLTFYAGFFLNEGYDQHMLGGIWPAILGTFYLTLGAMLIAGPLGVIAAIYFVEYAGDNRFVSFLRICVSTLAGVPSIVFGLFGLAFLINTVHVSGDKSVLAGSITLALLILPTVIRASEEAIKAVPNTYREASMGLGATKWRTVTTVVLPASLGGILTGTIISMGRAAGETAPIIFTAAVSVGKPIHNILQVFHQPTQALPWSIYNLCAEHQRLDEIRHVQYGMVMTLILLVLGLNLAAVILRARISKKLKG
ncbi:MAG: phosphate ABC transporter permease PstA [Candidatus Sumerlaeia bacterium]